MAVKPASMYMFVCPCVNNFKRNYLHKQWADHNKILAEASLGSLGWGTATLCFVFSDLTLVSMATDSFHRVIMEKSCAHSSAFTIGRIFFILVDNEDNHTISDEFEFGPDPTTDCVELSVLVHLKKIP